VADADVLCELAAVDRFAAIMAAYPGRTFGQLYHRFFRVNDLADGTIDLDGDTIRLGGVDTPVLSIAGEGDGIAPVNAVHAVKEFLPGVRLATAPGGHLGVLTGRAARRTTWPMLEEWLRGPDPPRGPAPRE